MDYCGAAGAGGIGACIAPDGACERSRLWALRLSAELSCDVRPPRMEDVVCMWLAWR